MIAIYILMVLLVLCSAFFSSSEIAFATMNKLRMEKAAEEGDRRSKLALAVSGDFPRFLSTILVGNELVNSAFSACVTMTLMELAVRHEDVWAPIVSAVILLIFGETVPKILGTDYADGLSRRFAPLLRVCMWVFTPVVALVTALVGRLSKLWTPAETEPEVTDDELVTILETIEDEGVFTEREGELIIVRVCADGLCGRSRCGFLRDRGRGDLPCDRGA